MDERFRDILERRRLILGSGARLFYSVPFHPVRGEGVYLYDGDGKRYLDAYNNVAHVGHGHPRVTEALSRQSAVLNTNTRYLFESVLEYGERLVATAGPGLDVCFFTCTGSEANDLAARIATAWAGNIGIITTRNAYHGNTALLSSIDGLKRKPQAPTPSFWATVNAPLDGGLQRPAEELTAGALAYADEMEAAIGLLASRGEKPGAFFFDSYFCSEGVHPTHAGFIAPALERLRAAGGLAIADEVQPGMGRNGEYFWGYQRLGVVPDMVTCGKPMGNGHPIGVVIARRELAEHFFAVQRYFNTFAGNPVSSMVGLAVLDVLRDERLQENARQSGALLRAEIVRLSARHDIVGEVRGDGLLIGVEMIKDRTTRHPACAEVKRLIDDLCTRGVLVGSTGPNFDSRNILKIRPPLVFDASHIDELVTKLDDALAAL